MSREVKGYPFEVVVPENLDVAGAVLVDQVKSLDRRARRAEFIARLPSELVAEAVAKIRALLEGDG